MVLNISKTKSIVFGSNHSLGFRPQLNLVMNDKTVEQVEETKLSRKYITKLLGVILDCKRSWSKHIHRFNGCKDRERSVCNKEMLCFFDTTRHKASAAGSSFVECPSL